MTTRATNSITDASAAAEVALPFSMKVSTRTETTSVWNGRLPDSSTSEPYSEIARAKDSAAPAAIAGRQARQEDPPQDRHPVGAERGRGLLDVGLELLEHGLDRPHDERQGHEGQRQRHRVLA